MFCGLWRIVKDNKQPIDSSLNSLSVNEYPYSINFVIRRRMQIDGYLELPKEKQPPRSIYDRPNDLEEFFERVYSSGEKQVEFTLPIEEGDIERIRENLLNEC